MKAEFLSWCKSLHSLVTKESAGDRSWAECAWKRFESLGLPMQKQEAFAYVPLLKLYQESPQMQSKMQTEKIRKEEIDKKILPESQGSYLVFVDGVYEPSLSCLEALPKSVQVVELESAIQGSYGAFLRHRLQRGVEQELDPFALLNGALNRGGVFVYVPPKVCVSTPIQLISISTSVEEPFSYQGPRIHLFGGAGSCVALVRTGDRTAEKKKGALFYNSFLDVAVEERAIVSLTDTTGFDEGAVWRFAAVRATVKKEGVFRSHLATFGSVCSRYDYHISLVGERAEADLSGVAGVLRGLQVHVHVHIDHAALRCVSHQRFKHGLLARAKASFTGKIYIRQVAQQTNAYQLNQNLLLDETAFAYSKPNLEIFADDVKASHGSTTAQIDPVHRHYLQTRGIPLKEATRLLTQGFFQEVFETLQPPSLKQQIKEQFERFE